MVTLFVIRGQARRNVIFLRSPFNERYTFLRMSAVQRTHTLSVLETVLRLQGFFRQRLLPLRISPMQAAILLHLDRHPACTLTDLASALCLHPVSMGANVLVVVRRGWASKTRTSENHRIVQLGLTATGKTLVKRVKQSIRSAKVKTPSLRWRKAA